MATKKHSKTRSAAPSRKSSKRTAESSASRKPPGPQVQGTTEIAGQHYSEETIRMTGIRALEALAQVGSANREAAKRAAEREAERELRKTEGVTLKGARLQQAEHSLDSIHIGALSIYQLSLTAEAGGDDSAGAIEGIAALARDIGMRADLVTALLGSVGGGAFDNEYRPVPEGGEA